MQVLSRFALRGGSSGHSDYVKKVSFSPDGTRVLTGSARDRTEEDDEDIDEDHEYGVIKLWDVVNGTMIRSHDLSSEVQALSFSQDGTKYVCVHGDMYDDDDEYSVDVYDTNEGGILNLIEGGGEQETIGPVSDVAFSPDGTNIVLAAESVVHLCDIASESYIRSFKGHSSDVWSVTFSPDGTKVASGSYGKVKLWDVTSGECLQTLEGHSRRVNSVSFSPDGTKVASGSGDSTVKLWDVTSGECLQTLEGHSSYVTSVSFSPDGTKVASKSYDGTLKLWDVTSGEFLQTLWGHTDWVQSVSFSPDGSKLLTASQEVIVYKMPQGQQETRMMLRPAVKLDRLDLLHSILNSF